MYDPEFDAELPKKTSPAVGSTSPTATRSRFHFDKVLSLLPVPRLAQANFAEAFRLGLREGFAVDRAARLASDVTPQRRIQSAIRQMAMHVRASEPLDRALELTGLRVRPSLLAALQVGEEHGTLVEELGAFAQRTPGFTVAKFYQRIGRSTEAIDFAGALARLLRENGLTVRAVRAAGQIAADGKASFAKTIETVASRIEDGESFVRALDRCPGDFDLLYCEFLAATNSRSEMKSCLERLGVRP